MSHIAAGAGFVVTCDVMHFLGAIRNFKAQTWKVIGAVLLVGIVAAGIIMTTLAEIHEEIAEQHEMHLDSGIQDEVHEDATPGLTMVAFALSWIGSPGVMVPVVPLLAALLWWKQLRHQAIVLLITTGGAEVLSLLLKLHFRRVRPDLPWAFAHEPTFSFPSGHSVFAVVLYGTLLYLGLRHLRRVRERVAVSVAALALILGIGYSRIYLGVHYPSDVAAGYFVGTVWLLAVMAADWYVRRNERVVAE